MGWTASDIVEHFVSIRVEDPDDGHPCIDNIGRAWIEKHFHELVVLLKVGSARIGDDRNLADEHPVADERPLPMLLWCPGGHRHIDEGDFESKPHHTHACQTCGIVWRPSLLPTVGVQFLPGFKDAPHVELPDEPTRCGTFGYSRARLLSVTFDYGEREDAPQSRARCPDAFCGCNGMLHADQPDHQQVATARGVKLARISNVLDSLRTAFGHDKLVSEVLTGIENIVRSEEV